MKKSENDSLIEKVENLMKMMNWEIENSVKLKSADLSLSINHFRTIIVECHFCMNLMTCKQNFSFVWKNSKTIFWEWTEWWIFIKFSISIHHFQQVLDSLDQEILFGFFHIDEKFSSHIIKFIQKWHSTLIVDMLCYSYLFCYSLKWTHARTTVDYIKEKILRRIKTSSLYKRFTRHVVDIKSFRQHSRAVFCLLLNHQYKEHTAIRKQNSKCQKIIVFSRRIRIVWKLIKRRVNK
jgi:hypothetical protein